MPEIDHPGVPATFVVDDNQAEIRLEDESLGRWSLFDVHVSRLIASAFQVDLAGEEVTFLADDPVDFAYKGVEHMAEAWARYKSMTLPRRVVAVARSRRRTTESRVDEFRRVMQENLIAQREAEELEQAEAASPPPPDLSRDLPPPAIEQAPVEKPTMPLTEIPAASSAEHVREEQKRLEEERAALETERAQLERQKLALEEALAEAERLERERLEAAARDVEKLEEERRALEERIASMEAQVEAAEEIVEAGVEDPEESKELVVDLGELEDDPPEAEAVAEETEPQPPPPPPQPALAGAEEKSGFMGAVRAAFNRTSRDHVHEFTEAPGGIGIVRYICRECGYVSIST